jgi:hypothetical protein
MIDLRNTAVEAPKKGNASSKVERVKSSAGDDWRDQVAREFRLRRNANFSMIAWNIIGEMP